jgi:hypothetical protein
LVCLSFRASSQVSFVKIWLTGIYTIALCARNPNAANTCHLYLKWLTHLMVAFGVILLFNLKSEQCLLFNVVK